MKRFFRNKLNIEITFGIIGIIIGTTFAVLELMALIKFIKS